VSEGWPGNGVIRTPDRRLRVFVSSTLEELAAERRAVARAIAALRLTPVMFELGGAAALAASHQLGPLLEERPGRALLDGCGRPHRRLPREGRRPL
jgi:hypothetical protein